MMLIVRSKFKIGAYYGAHQMLPLCFDGETLSLGLQDFSLLSLVGLIILCYLQGSLLYFTLLLVLDRCSGMIILHTILGVDYTPLSYRSLPYFSELIILHTLLGVDYIPCSSQIWICFIIFGVVGYMPLSLMELVILSYLPGSWLYSTL